MSTPAPAPAEPAAARDEEVARRLGRARRQHFLLVAAASLVLPGLAWSSGLSARWAAALSALLPAWAVAPALVAGLLALYRLLLLPASYGWGYWLPRRYGLATQSPAGWLLDWLKASALGVALGTLVASLFYLCVAALGPHWWWGYALLLSAGAVLLAYVTPYVLVPLFYPLRPLDSPPLAARIAALFERAGVRPPRVAVIALSRRTAEANAAVIGLGGSRRVVLGDTLLAQFTPEEIETIVAHELGHHVRGDIWRGIALELAAIWGGLALAAWLLPWVFATWGLGDWRAPAAFPLLALLAAAAGLATMPVVNAWSRACERAADRYAVALSGNGAAFAAALERLAAQNRLERQPPRWAELLLATHPSVAERVARARGGACA
jgi:STE24 endopeptidase